MTVTKEKVLEWIKNASWEDFGDILRALMVCQSRNHPDIEGVYVSLPVQEPERSQCVERMAEILRGEYYSDNLSL